MERWHLPSIEASGTREPRVLFSQPEFRGVVLDLNDGDELGDHRLYERSFIHVISGKLGVSGDREIECDAGTLLSFAAKETRSVRALEPSRILLVLAPWPGEGHFPGDREVDPERIAARAPSRHTTDSPNTTALGHASILVRIDAIPGSPGIGNWLRYGLMRHARDGWASVRE